MWRARDQWPSLMLDKVRLGALAFGLFACVGPLNLLEGSFGPGRRLVSVVSLALLAGLFALTWRLRRIFTLEPFLAAPLALGCSYGLSDPMIMIGTLLGIAASQSLYGRAWTFAVRTALLLPVLPVAVALTPSAGKDLAWTSAQALTQSVLPVLVGFLMRTLRWATIEQEQALAREKIVADAGQQLLGLTRVGEVRDVLRQATNDLCRATPDLVLVAAMLSGGRLWVVQAHGLPDAEMAGHDLALPLELLPLVDRKLTVVPMPPEHVAAVRTVLGIDRRWYVMGMVLDDVAHRENLVMIGLGDRTPDAALHLLPALAAQQALAERACRAHGELNHQAHHDDLTGLPNRALLFRELEQALDEGRRKPVALLLVDLDGFKGVNDTRGHAAGDAVLVEVGLRMRSVLAGIGPAGSGLAARLGGDEFAVLLSGLPLEEAVAVAERMGARIRDPIEVEDVGPVRIGASIGLAVAGADTAAGKLIGLADVAMYAAKTGRSGVQVFSADQVVR